jgi:hypothetical protein
MIRRVATFQVCEKTLLFILREPQARPESIKGTNGGAVETIGVFSVHAEPSRRIHRVLQQNLKSCLSRRHCDLPSALKSHKK